MTNPKQPESLDLAIRALEVLGGLREEPKA